MRILIPCALAAALGLSACGGQENAAGADAAQTAAAGAAAEASGASTPDAASAGAGDTTSAPADIHQSASGAAGSGPQGVTPPYGQPGGAPSAVTSQSKGSTPSVGNDAPPNIN